MPRTSFAARMVRRCFRGEHARALFAGNAAHPVVPLTASPTAAFGLTLSHPGAGAGPGVRRNDTCAHGGMRRSGALVRHREMEGTV